MQFDLGGYVQLSCKLKENAFFVLQCWLMFSKFPLINMSALTRKLKNTSFAECNRRRKNEVHFSKFLHFAFKGIKLFLWISPFADFLKGIHHFSRGESPCLKRVKNLKKDEFCFLQAYLFHYPSGIIWRFHCMNRISSYL